MKQEFDAQLDTWTDIALGLERHPVVLVRRGVDPALLGALLQEAHAEFGRRDAAPLSGTLPPGMHDMHLKYRSIIITELAVNGIPAQNLLVTPLVAAAATLVLRKTPHIFASHFRSVQINTENTNLTLPFHQDSRIIGRLRPDEGPMPPLINMWIPLEDCGSDRPGLELVNVPTNELIPVSNAGANIYASLGLEIPAETIQRTFQPEALWHPHFSAGDFLLFKGTTIHRTYITPAMTGDRISADIRLV